MGGPKRVLRRSEEGFKKVFGPQGSEIFWTEKYLRNRGGVEIEVGRYAGGG